MGSDEPVMVIEDEGGVRTIRLNRPQVLNALNDELLIELDKAMRAAGKENRVRCLVITGAGRAFCSGQDLGDVRHRYDSDEPIEFGQHLRALYNPPIMKMRTLEKPVIGAINGVAAGAGCSLGLRHPNRGPLCELHSGVHQRRTRAGFGRHVHASQTNRHLPRDGAGLHRP